MRIALLFALFFVSTLISKAQILEPVKWSFSQEKLSDTRYKLIFSATIDKKWHVYSQRNKPDVVIPISFTFKANPKVKLLGKVKEESEVIDILDPVFNEQLRYFENKAVFSQLVEAEKGTKFSGELEYMACDDKQCLPPQNVLYSFVLDGNNVASGPGDNIVIGTEESHAGFEDPIKWNGAVKLTADNKATVTVSAKLDAKWHIYSMKLPAGDGPETTALEFKLPNGVKQVGAVREVGKLKNEFDPNFDRKLLFFEHEVAYEIDFEFIDKKSFEGSVYFMVCDDKQCLPPRNHFFKVDLENLTVNTVDETEGQDALVGDVVPKLEQIDLKNPVAACGEPQEEETSNIFTIFFLGFIGGLIALLTPCVFPMIPLTVSFFTKGNSDKKKGIRNATIYGGFIFLIYILLSLPFHLLDSIEPEILNEISTNIYLNVFFFVIFIFFAFSFFGYYEITLPSSVANKMDSKSEAGGIIGSFFMALTLAIVSFSCTGPILGSLLVGSLTADGGAFQLTAGMGGFGLALALPFALFAAFPSWLKSLPSSGGWLNNVKVVLGFIELALAFKFLSNADLVAHWGLLKYETFMVLWVLVAIGLTLYLFGKIRFPHDPKKVTLTGMRTTLAVVALVLTVYLMSGFRFDKETRTFNSLSLLSGLAPPAGYSIMYPSKCPNNFKCFKDLEEGMAYAKKVNKPIMLDFTGWACVNCRKMEEHVWTKDEIKGLINEELILISLYVDDKAELPKEQQGVYETKRGTKKMIKTVGDKWSTLQSEYFGKNTQPQYAIISPEGVLLNNPVPYTPDTKEYKAFLECGINAFKKVTIK